MLKKTVFSMVIVASALASFTTFATPTRQQARDAFNEKMVQPCAGKKAGDEVTITDRRGDKIQAVCTLTAVPKAKS
jgi:cytochrome oxidase Cu insertion factor (SCO1/SenC/PrrC family)